MKVPNQSSESIWASEKSQHIGFQRLLNDDQKATRVCISQLLRTRFEEGEALHKIATSDETWVHHYTPESKHASTNQNSMSAGKMLAMVLGIEGVSYW
ncbi:MAG: hypothetical protein E7Y34_00725 [Mycoplasma sp.]|nr:hypothetical protein [Mycoplasma sp.]